MQNCGKQESRSPTELELLFTNHHCQTLGLQSRRPATGVSRGPRAGSVPRSLPRARARERESVPENGGASPGCQAGVRTLLEHSRNTLWTLQRPGPEGPRRHPLGHPLFQGPSGTLPRILRARSARATPVAVQRDLNSWGCGGWSCVSLETPYISESSWRAGKKVARPLWLVPKRLRTGSLEGENSCPSKCSRSFRSETLRS